MARRMSCALTIDAVRARTKTVTRRQMGSWAALVPGDRLTLIEKGMGLPKGARQVVLAEVEVVDVRIEPVGRIFDEDGGTALEGLGHMTNAEFVRFWCGSHGHKTLPFHQAMQAPCVRIEWRYLDDLAAS